MQLFSFKQAAQKLKRELGGKGNRTLYKLLREAGVLSNRNKPMPGYEKYFIVMKVKKANFYGHETYEVTRMTTEGLEFTRETLNRFTK